MTELSSVYIARPTPAPEGYHNGIPWSDNDLMLEEAAFHLQKRLDSPEVVDICSLALASVLDEFAPFFLATYTPAIPQWAGTADAGPADAGPESSVSLKHPYP